MQDKEAESIRDLIGIEEILENESKYPFRIEFEPITILPEKSWNKKGVYTQGLQFYHGVNPIYDKLKIDKIIEELR